MVETLPFPAAASAPAGTRNRDTISDETQAAAEDCHLT
jgi:hypothetical protein